MRHIKLCFIALFVFLLAVTLCLAENTSSFYDVIFQTNGGNNVDTQTIESGQVVIKPADPVKEGFSFSGWYLNGSLFDFSTPIVQETTLIASWIPIHTVTFTVQTNNGNVVSDSVQILDGEQINNVPDSIQAAIAARKGYIFEGWYILWSHR